MISLVNTNALIIVARTEVVNFDELESNCCYL
jgi:hypothetical protein